MVAELGLLVPNSYLNLALAEGIPGGLKVEQ